MNYIFRLNYWQEHVKPLLNYIYIINNINFTFYGNINFYTNKQKIDLTNPELTKIYSFYTILNGVDYQEKILLLHNIIVAESGYHEDKTWYTPIGLEGMQDMGDYYIHNDFTEGIIKTTHISFGYSCCQDENLDLPIPELNNDVREGKLNFKEFYLLMQLYFGLYQNEELKKELEENEKKGKYNEIKKHLKIILGDKSYDLKNYYEYIDGNKNVEEYFKLELMRKDTTGAFGGLKIEKIFDKTWNEEKQKERIEKINKEFGEEIIVLEG